MIEMRNSLEPIDKRILVVEDERAIAHAVQVFLEDEGWRVTTAGSGEEALEIPVDERPDRYLLDNRLPGMDGIDLAERLRAEARGRIRIVLMSGDLHLASLVKKGTIDAFLEKPFQLDDLLSAVSE